MEICVIKNGTTRIVITPTSEVEKLLLEEVLKGPVEIVSHDKLQILDKPVNNCYVISKKEEQ